MFNEVTRKWIDELESGNWQQAQSALKKGETYCCLGVLCEISKMDDWEEVPDEHFAVLDFYLGEYAELPEEIADLVGLATVDGQFGVTDAWWESLLPATRQVIEPHFKNHTFLTTKKNGLRTSSSLAMLNDAGVGFETIASIIKSNPSGLFDVVS